MAAPFWVKQVRTTKMRKFQDLTYYACEGLIALHDARDDSFECLTPNDFETHVKALAKHVEGMQASDKAYERDMHAMCRRAIPEMYEVLQEARYMGDPSDPRVQAYWAKHRDRKSKVSLSSGSNLDGYPQLPYISRGPNTGKTAATDGQLPATPQPRKLPRKKPRSGLILPADML